MSGENDTTEIQQWRESVDSELYEELLNRYERILVFAGQLQEKLARHQVLEEKHGRLEEENDRLRQHVAVDTAYIKLLEKSLESLGVMPASEVEAEPEDPD